MDLIYLTLCLFTQVAERLKGHILWLNREYTHTLEFRLDGTKINGENNTEQCHIVIKQEEKGYITLAVKLKTLVSYFIRCTPGY